MKNLLEKTITHLLNNEEAKAAALFHKFMVEQARKIHESLRQEEEVDLGEGWDNEIKEEEYFGDDDMASAEDDTSPMGDDVAVDDLGGDSMDDIEGMNTTDAGMDDAMDDAEADSDLDTDMDSEMDDTGDLGGKIDNIESKIDELTAEFERLMGTLDTDEMGDDSMDDVEDMDTVDNDEFEDVEGEEPSMEHGEADDLAGRMDSDLGDDEKPESDSMDADDEDLADITESVLSELDKIASPSNTDGKEIGSGGKTISGNRTSTLPNNPINSRIDGAKPVMVKGGNNDSFEREEAPTRKPVSSMVSNLRKNASRNSYKDGMGSVPANGDGSAMLNKDFTSGEAKTRSIIDGNKKPKTS